MSHKMVRPFIVKVPVLGYFPLYSVIIPYTVKNKWYNIDYKMV